MKRLALLLCLVALPAAGQVPDEFTNLTVFPKDIGKRELISAMRSFSGALGVRCNHCHMGPENLEGMDFATDKFETKRVTRAMMKLTREINDKLLPATGRDSLIRVECATCHRGVARPQQLGDILDAAIEADGVEAGVARYRELREEHYGAGSYDFSAATLAGVAEGLAREQGDMDGAIAITQLNIEMNPDAAYGHIMLGQLLMQKGDKPGAVASLKRAIELEPDNDYAKRMLGRVQAAE